MSINIYQLKLKKGIDADLPADQKLIVEALSTTKPLDLNLDPKDNAWLNNYSHLAWYVIPEGTKFHQFPENENNNEDIFFSEDDYIVFCEDNLFSQPIPFANFNKLSDGVYYFYPDNQFPKKYSIQNINNYIKNKPFLFKLIPAQREVPKRYPDRIPVKITSEHAQFIYFDDDIREIFPSNENDLEAIISLQSTALEKTLLQQIISMAPLVIQQMIPRDFFLTISQMIPKEILQAVRQGNLQVIHRDLPSLPAPREQPEEKPKEEFEEKPKDSPQSIGQEIIKDMHAISLSLGENNTAYLITLFDRLTKLLESSNDSLKKESILNTLKRIHNEFNIDICGEKTSIIDLLGNEGRDVDKLDKSVQVNLNRALHRLMYAFSDLEEATKPLGLKALEIIGGIIGFIVGGLVGAIVLHLIVGGPFNPASIFAGLVGFAEGAMLGHAIGAALMLALSSTTLLSITTFFGKSTPTCIIATKDCFFKPVNAKGELDSSNLTIYSATRLAVAKGMELFKKQVEQLVEPPNKIWDYLPILGR